MRYRYDDDENNDEEEATDEDEDEKRIVVSSAVLSNEPHIGWRMADGAVEGRLARAPSDASINHWCTW